MKYYFSWGMAILECCTVLVCATLYNTCTSSRFSKGCERTRYAKGCESSFFSLSSMFGDSLEQMCTVVAYVIG